ncbi:MAG: alpha/beta hydrolase [Chitinophagaceae bacterium]|jgi:acetyl esterase/lipase|nr:alpha/beta hydrolase [Chitinophagaceae bacterium]
MKILWHVACLLFLSFQGFSQKVIPLYEGQIPNAKKDSGFKEQAFDIPMGRFETVVLKPTLTLYLPDKKINTGLAVIICPGGGYTGIASGHEGDSIAMRLRDEGITGIVLRYRLPNPKYVNNKEFVPLQDAQQAIALVRKNAKAWGINPSKLGIMGSSAGGHLASTIGTHFTKTYLAGLEGANLRPDFLILNYPVISFADSLTHIGSRFNLAGPVLPDGEYERITKDWENADKEFAKYPVPAEKIREYSNELHVTPNTPPTFITHANDDDVVKVQNSILFIAALQQNKVAVNAFFYAKGGHGYGMDNKTSDVDWFESCVQWLRSGAWMSRPGKQP